MIEKMLEDGAKVFDVRTAAEYAEGTFENAVNIPHVEVPSRLDEFGDKSDVIIVFCKSGNRSGIAKSALESAGFTNVTNGGGLEDMLALDRQ